MRCLLFVFAALLVAVEVRGETIMIDDGRDHHFFAGDLNSDDLLIVDRGRAFLNDSIFSEMRLAPGTSAAVLSGTEIAAVRTSGGKLFARRGATIDTINIDSGDLFLSLEGSHIRQLHTEPGVSVELNAGGIMLSVTGSWESNTARLVGVTGHRDALAQGVDSPDDPNVAAVTDLPLDNRSSWQITAQWNAGVSRQGDCEIIFGNEPCWVMQTMNTVDIDELNFVRNGFGRNPVLGRPNWQGDVDYDNDIDLDDLNMVRNHFGENGQWSWEAPTAPSAVPEPSSLLMLSLATFVLSTRRRRSLPRR